MVLNESQTEASSLISNWGATGDKTFFLNGRAGTGKTFLVSEIARGLITGGYVVVLAPTHKALGVLRQKLSDAGVPTLEIKDAKTGPRKNVVYLATHSSFLGISPMITEEQDIELKFGKNRDGTSSRFKDLRPVTVIMDESSMLSRGGHRLLNEWADSANGKVLFVGDTGQLPPVKAKPAPLEKITSRFELTQIVRQAEGSSIVTLAGDIRSGKSLENMHEAGADVKVWNDAERKPFVDAFLETLVLPTSDVGDTAMSVYVAYRNVVVNRVNKLACQRAYGHGSDVFKVGERVISQEGISLWDSHLRREVSFAHTSEPLEVVNWGEEKVQIFCEEIGEDIYANPITLKSIAPGVSGELKFTAYYLSPTERNDPNGLYTRELNARSKKAMEIQKKYGALKKIGDKREYSVNTERKSAWVRFFVWKDRTMAKITHPFAITSHKSQGSTYKRAWVDARDILSAPGGEVQSRKSLYVAVTRASEQVDIFI